MIPFIQKFVILVCALVLLTQPVFAHHVLGRPSYSLSEGSNTPPSMQVETEIGNYFVTYMVFPAFPKANVAGRVNLYISHIDKGVAYDGAHGTRLKFSRADHWHANKEEYFPVFSSDC